MTDCIYGDDVSFDGASATYRGALSAETTFTASRRLTKTHASYRRERVLLGRVGSPLHAGNSSP